MVPTPQGSDLSRVNVPLGTRSYSIEISSGSVDRFANAIGNCVRIRHPVYEMVCIARLDDWKRVLADSQAEDEVAYLFKVQWTGGRDANKFAFFDLDRVHWENLSSAGWEDENMMPSATPSKAASPKGDKTKIGAEAGVRI